MPNNTHWLVSCTSHDPCDHIYLTEKKASMTGLRGHVVVAPATWLVSATTLQSIWCQHGFNILGSSSIGYVTERYRICHGTVSDMSRDSIGYVAWYILFIYLVLEQNSKVPILCQSEVTFIVRSINFILLFANHTICSTINMFRFEIVRAMLTLSMPMRLHPSSTSPCSTTYHTSTWYR